MTRKIFLALKGAFFLLGSALFAILALINFKMGHEFFGAAFLLISLGNFDLIFKKVRK